MAVRAETLQRLLARETRAFPAGVPEFLCKLNDMKLLLLLITVVLTLPSIAFAQQSKINIIPTPNKVRLDAGYFKLTKRTRIRVEAGGGETMAGILNEFLSKNYNFKLRFNGGDPAHHDVIVFMPLPQGRSDSGEYTLTVDENAIYIAGAKTGLYYGLQSLLQLLPETAKDSIQIPSISISDQPRFPYRGMHLDVGRHFMPVSFVKKYIDLMSQYKFNYFHWHLTEDQGWRIEIKKYPRLTEVGSKRKETVKERNLQPYIGDNTPVEGFYTQEEIKDVITYAKARYITVVPEIELPGHSSAALAAYPEFGCKQDYQYKVQTTWGIFKEVYCPTEKTFKFLEDVLTEVIDLFPDSPFIHIGGDEVLKDMWKESPEVKELMAREGLKDEHEVQSYFIRRMEKFINSKGKKIIGWDEILEGGLAPNATVMSWRGMRGGIEAAKAHHDVIMTPTEYAYLNFGQGDPAYEPLSYPDYIPLERVYSFNPVPKELSAEEAKYIIGGQGNLWTEYIKTPATAEYQLFPRLLALAEVLWTKPENKDYVDFLRRLSAQLVRLDKQNVNYRIPEPAGLRNTVLGTDEKLSLTLAPPMDGAKIYYTVDGSTPDEKSRPYERPIEIDLPQGGRVDLRTVVVLPSGRKSSVYAATVLRRDHLPAVDAPAERRPGVTFGFTAPAGAGVMPVTASGETRSIALQQFARLADLKQPFTAAFDGYLNVPADAIYEFQTDATWDAAIAIDGEKVVESIGIKDRAVRSNIVPLKAGWHRIALRYNHRGGEAGWRIRWGVKGTGLAGLGNLVH
jgi:hexosaminidase